jgi:hypothetical protein
MCLQYPKAVFGVRVFLFVVNARNGIMATIIENAKKGKAIEAM